MQEISDAPKGPKHPLTSPNILFYGKRRLLLLQ